MRHWGKLRESVTKKARSTWRWELCTEGGGRDVKRNGAARPAEGQAEGGGQESESTCGFPSESRFAQHHPSRFPALPTVQSTTSSRGLPKFRFCSAAPASSRSSWLLLSMTSSVWRRAHTSRDIPSSLRGQLAAWLNPPLPSPLPSNCRECIRQRAKLAGCAGGGPWVNLEHSWVSCTLLGMRTPEKLTGHSLSNHSARTPRCLRLHRPAIEVPSPHQTSSFTLILSVCRLSSFFNSLRLSSSRQTEIGAPGIEEEPASKPSQGVRAPCLRGRAQCDLVVSSFLSRRIPQN
jgi:hypothetical protein